MKSAFDPEPYEEAPEPGRRERAYAWATAIGLQAVDGLKPSPHLLDTARRHVEGEITQEEARRLVDNYYETKLGHGLPPDVREADKVSARMAAIVNAPGFRLSPEYFTGLHKAVFDGVFPHAGEIRDVELTKREWVLDGGTVTYGLSCLIGRSLAYDFEKERRFKYKGLSEDAFAEHFASFVSGLWQIHPFREGNTRTTALFAIQYLRSMQYDVTNALFARESWFFRNALVRANYSDRKRDVEPTLAPLADFFKVLVFGRDIPLRNRFLKIGAERGTPAGRAVDGLHRRKGRGDVGTNGGDVGINVGINLSASEKAAAKAIRDNPKLTAVQLGAMLGVSPRQAERIVASLKVKAGLERVGSRKAGEWRFRESPAGFR